MRRGGVRGCRGKTVCSSAVLGQLRDVGQREGAAGGHAVDGQRGALDPCTLTALLIWGDFVALLTGASKGALQVDARSVGADPRGQTLIHICGREVQVDPLSPTQPLASG